MKQDVKSQVVMTNFRVDLLLQGIESSKKENAVIVRTQGEILYFHFQEGKLTEITSPNNTKRTMKLALNILNHPQFPFNEHLFENCTEDIEN